MPTPVQTVERATETINLGPFTLEIEYHKLNTGDWYVSWSMGDCPKSQYRHNKPLGTQQKARKTALTEAKNALGSQIDNLCQALSTIARTRRNT